jgi:hypothetical protein
MMRQTWVGKSNAVDLSWQCALKLGTHTGKALKPVLAR